MCTLHPPDDLNLRSTLRPSRPLMPSTSPPTRIIRRRRKHSSGRPAPSEFESRMRPGEGSLPARGARCLSPPPQRAAPCGPRSATTLVKPRIATSPRCNSALRVQLPHWLGCLLRLDGCDHEPAAPPSQRSSIRAPARPPRAPTASATGGMAAPVMMRTQPSRGYSDAAMPPAAISASTSRRTGASGVAPRTVSLRTA